MDASAPLTFRLPLIAILRGVRPQEVLAHIEALVDEGWDAIEIPLNSPEWADSIGLAVRHFGARALIGAGTVLREADVDTLAGLGARFIVTPNTRAALIRHAVQRNLPVVAGFATASEAFEAIDAGAQMLKLFPASVYGPQLVRALRAILPPRPSAPDRSPSAAEATDGRERPTIPLFVVGGISPANLPAYVAAGSTGAGIGGELYKAGQPVERTQLQAREFKRAFLECSR